MLSLPGCCAFLHSVNCFNFTRKTQDFNVIYFTTKDSKYFHKVTKFFQKYNLLAFGLPRLNDFSRAGMCFTLSAFVVILSNHKVYSPRDTNKFKSRSITNVRSCNIFNFLILF